jgi:hypothetical protein
MQHSKRPLKWRMLWLGSIIPLLAILAACGGAQTSAGTASTGAVDASQRNTAAQPASAPLSNNNNAQTQQGKSANFIGPQYLIKSLKVTMEVNDTRQVANDLQSWVSNTDPRATSAGMDYEQTGNNLFNITMTFSVQANIYPQIQQYLGNYPAQHGGQLLSMTETVQDVTNDYVDTQARLKNLRTEETRLQTLMSQAQNLNDLLTIEQRLTDVQSQIESTEAQLNTLTSQVTFYPVTIVLQPVETATPPPPPPGWSAGQVFHDAIAASIAFGQGLVSFLIWLLAFSIYIIPIIAIVWFIRRWRTRSRGATMPKWPSFTNFPPATQFTGSATKQEEARTTTASTDGSSGEEEAQAAPEPTTSGSSEESATVSTDDASSDEPVTSTSSNSHH